MAGTTARRTGRVSARTPVSPVRSERRVAPSFAVELGIAAALPGPGPHVIVGLDEVGRGAIAGPVTVGACAVRIEDGAVTTPLTDEVRDSKLLSAARREALAPILRESALAHGLGWCSAAEIDRIGIMAALAVAARGALTDLGVVPDAILLDGTVNVLAPRDGDPRGVSPSVDPGAPELRGGPGIPASTASGTPLVHLRVKADRDCRSVAAASVLAKVARDAHLRELHEGAPQYGWAANKGYGSAAHRAALAEHGPHAQHRRTWLRGIADATEGPGRADMLPVVLWEDRPIAGDPTSSLGRDAS